ncbi:peptidylprolyl isomerase [Paludicola sp. MB14-C6]|uniref:peptidylprolyl isomerase n=1 Tax=Paludihabitans sp. MB14-C6 TaxID=3070656 RepID=UPI0027DE65B6|nr:peptidylprolyl isomerase [Paludicola sp. MB14-C6]WMJ22459.1 peptidylprolyl isomerase [Paludicola sp. MB14-C6]
MKKILSVFLCVAMLTAVLAGCTSKSSNSGKHKLATMTIKGYGDIVLELYPEKAPKTVENFVKLSEKGYYNGVTFHRIMQDFMMQGGDPEGTGMGGESIWGKPFEDEFSDLRNFYGAISMANSGPNTNGSQFFIVNTKQGLKKDQVDGIRAQQGLEDAKYSSQDYKRYEKEGGTPWLDKVHTVFGYVVKGMDIVDKIATVETDSKAKPTKPIVIDKITIKDK